MSNAAAVRGGGVGIEIFANDSKFMQAMTRVTNKIRSVATTMQRIGTSMSLGGAGLGAPLVLAGRQAAGFEDAVLAMQGAAGLSADEVVRLSDAAKGLSKEMGISPTKLAQAFLELAKAGMSVEDILAGAGKSAVEFSKVGGVDAERAAVFMKGAMNVFGVSAEEAVDTLTAAANSSETSIANMVESFSQVGSAGKTFGQSLFGVSQAMAVLANNTIVGEEAGTAIKTMLTKLVAPTKDAEEALGRLGLRVTDFRDSTGNLLPLQQIAGIFEKVQDRLGGDAFSKMMSDSALVDVFEQRGIKVITAFANAGEEGFAKIGREMTQALPVSEQFVISMSGLSGSVEKLNSSIERLSIAFGEAVEGPFGDAAEMLVAVMGAITALVEKVPGLGVAIAALAAGLVALGAAALAAAIAMKGLAAAKAVVLAMSGPMGWAALAVGLGIVAGLAADAAMGMGEEFERAEAAAEAAKAAAAEAKNSVTPDVNRDPLDPALVERQRAAEQLALADQEFEEAQQQAVARLRELSNDIVGEVDTAVKDLGASLEDTGDQLGIDLKDLSDAVFKAGVEFQQGMRKLAEDVDAGILNSPAAQVLADRLRANFDAQVEILKKQIDDATPKPRDFGGSLGGFSGAQLGIGPELAAAVRAAAGLAQDEQAAKLAAGRRDAMSGLSAAAAPGGVEASVASSVDRMLAQIAQQTKVVSDQTPILKKIADGVAKGGLVFA